MHHHHHHHHYRISTAPNYNKTVRALQCQCGCTKWKPAGYLLTSGKCYVKKVRSELVVKHRGHVMLAYKTVTKIDKHGQ